VEDKTLDKKKKGKILWILNAEVQSKTRRKNAEIKVEKVVV
jgi:hypothetical protein